MKLRCNAWHYGASSDAPSRRYCGVYADQVLWLHVELDAYSHFWGDSHNPSRQVPSPPRPTMAAGHNEVDGSAASFRSHSGIAVIMAHH
jgi:hypothetical protein